MSDRPANRVLAALHDPTAWLITDEAHAQLVEIASREHDPAAAAEYRAAAGSRALSSRATTASGTTAVLEVAGPLVRRATMFSDVSGLSSTDALSDEFAALDADPDVTRIVIKADSPGGQVSGIAEFAGRVRDAKTPTVAHVSDIAASAMYWIASQADEITTTSTGVLGSIGVIGRAPGKPDPDDVVSTGAPNKRGDRRAVQAAVDALERELHEAVAAGRGVTAEHVAEHFGKGGIFVGRDAVAAGLADRVTTFDALLAERVTPPARPAPSTETSPMSDKQTGGETVDNTAAINAAREEGRKAGAAESAEKAVAAERTRVAQIMAAGKGKSPETVTALIEQGMSAEAALAVLGTVPDAAPSAKVTSLTDRMAGTNPRIANDAEELSAEDADDRLVMATIKANRGAQA